jgi:hypothetical protein
MPGSGAISTLAAGEGAGCKAKGGRREQTTPLLRTCRLLPAVLPGSVRFRLPRESSPDNFSGEEGDRAENTSGWNTASGWGTTMSGGRAARHHGIVAELRHRTVGIG